MCDTKYGGQYMLNITRGSTVSMGQVLSNTLELIARN